MMQMSKNTQKITIKNIVVKKWSIGYSSSSDEGRYLIMI